MSSVMQHVVTINPSGITFSVPADKTILVSALAYNIVLEHSCGTGLCGACKAKVLSGDVACDDPHGVLSAEEKAKGVVLTCTSRPLTALELEAEYFPELAAITPKTVPCKVASLTFPVTDVAALRLRLPPTAQLVFLPGQYIDLTAQGVTRSYSVANASVENNQLELHIRKVPGGQLSDIIFNQLKPEQLLRMYGPLGSFFVRDDQRPLVFLAGGTGFAPVKAMVEALLAKGDPRAIHIYWGQRQASGFYSSLPGEWAAQYDHIQAHVVVSDDASWAGRRGLVHEAVLADIPDLSGYAVYACGSPAMIAAAKCAFTQQGLNEMAFYADAFLPAVTQ